MTGKEKSAIKIKLIIKLNLAAIKLNVAMMIQIHKTSFIYMHKNFIGFFCSKHILSSSHSTLDF